MWFGLFWRDMVIFVLTWCDIKWNDVIWNEVIWYDAIWYCVLCPACVHALYVSCFARRSLGPSKLQLANNMPQDRQADVALEIASNPVANELRISRSLSNSISNKIERGLALTACCGHSIASPKFARLNQIELAVYSETKSRLRVARHFFNRFWGSSPSSFRVLVSKECQIRCTS